MSLHDDLLEQAKHLAIREIKKPKQASLRRGISAAYYALFHLITADGAQLLAPGKPANLKALVQRAFKHGDMNKVCQAFIAAHLNPSNLKIMPATRHLLSQDRNARLTMNAELIAVLRAFVLLQEERHLADYDLIKKWNRTKVLLLVETARQAFGHWGRVRKTSDASVFMSALLLQRHWNR